MARLANTLLLLAPAALGALAVLLLYLASLPVPPNRTTFAGDSGFEARFRKRQGMAYLAGTLLAAAAICSGMLEAIASFIA